ncbi:MAG: ABC transporter permease [Nocardiopsaceae bacterium]|jgi:ABC-2 type transport system permease protein|nr:ABC transporter permease [Nocardiopsaceae bacterium]
MTASTATLRPTPATTGLGSSWNRSAQAFLAILHRDLHVTRRELPAFLTQVVLQPLFLLFVFGKVLTELGYTRPGYTSVLFPGIVALTAFVTALQGIALPLSVEFSFTGDVQDRLQAPLPTSLVAVEKLLFSTLRALAAAAIMFPLGILVLGVIPWRGEGLPMAIAILTLAALNGSATGLILGTLATANRISLVFALVLTPLLFTGCSQYPWQSLAQLPWFQVITACNPLTYASEGLRTALSPQIPHLPGWACVLALTGWSLLLGAAGIRGFLRRALD